MHPYLSASERDFGLLWGLPARPGSGGGVASAPCSGEDNGGRGHTGVWREAPISNSGEGLKDGRGQHEATPSLHDARMFGGRAGGSPLRHGSCSI